MNKSYHTTERLIHCIGFISHVFGIYLICVGTTFLSQKMLHRWDLDRPQTSRN